MEQDMKITVRGVSSVDIDMSQPERAAAFYKSVWNLTEVERRDGSIGISVCDDGIGLPPHRRRGNPFHETGGIGLWSIDHRLRELDAVLDIEAVEGVGTRAMLILPARRVIRLSDQTPRCSGC